MNLAAALEKLAAAGITTAVLAAEGVDPADLDALRALVDALLGAALAENILTCRRQVAALEAARELLLTDAERVEVERLVARWHASRHHHDEACTADAALAA